MTKLIHGKDYARRIMANLKEHITAFRLKRYRPPKLAMILVGDNPPSVIYVNKKQQACKDIGMESLLHHLPTTTSRQQLEALIDDLSEDSSVDGVLLQLPLPEPLRGMDIIQTLCPYKDVDGLTAWNQGKLALNQEGLFPCTPLGCMHLIKHNLPNPANTLSGLNAIVVGHSALVGAPLAKMLLHSECTVTTLHSESQSPQQYACLADILVVAAGSQGLITEEWVKEGSVVIDVGINRTDNGIVGDVDFNKVKHLPYAITPVPGGVGPMTIAILLTNTLHAYYYLNHNMPLCSFDNVITSL
ncbi:MAG: bifunctional 5,10-methylenetetrahydrofolate dehydrogenase/5,10-methenyltetrahydrofolate cyclohydrolase [Proteobacteria bacterium]|nr:bifunctional 5,10-methylenetetrahydrofolate dehydrogenase/5,10-methenyltetrahydrofolate cyclohydrolase [Pseudomonadota bacterium]